MSEISLHWILGWIMLFHGLVGGIGSTGAGTDGKVGMVGWAGLVITIAVYLHSYSGKGR